MKRSAYFAVTGVVIALALVVVVNLKSRPAGLMERGGGSAPMTNIMDSPVRRIDRAGAANFSADDLCEALEQMSDRSMVEVYDDKVAANHASRNDVIARVTVSSNPALLHGAAMLEDSLAGKIVLLSNAIAVDDNNSHLLWEAVRVCGQIEGQAGCALSNWQNRLLELDPQNSETWMMIAAQRYRAGNEILALDALYGAGVAAESRIYFVENIELMERVYAAGSDYSFAERNGSAFAVAASSLPHFGDQLAMCQERSESSVDWAHACLHYGELLERQGKTELGVAISLPIQIVALRALGEYEKAADVEARQEADRLHQSQRFKNRDHLSELLMFTDPSLFAAYLAEFRTSGETQAQDFLAEETARWRKLNPHVACLEER